MKTHHMLAAALIAGLAFAPNAQAAVIDLVSTTAGPLGTADTGSYTLTHDPASTTSDTLSGILPSNSQVVVTYDFSAGTPYLADLTATAAGGGELIHAHAATSDVLGTTPDASTSMIGLPVVVTAGFEGDPLGTATVQNLSTTPINFSSLFTAAIFNATEGGTTLVTYAASQIPLPRTVFFFALGLLTLLGFSLHKRASGQI